MRAIKGQQTRESRPVTSVKRHSTVEKPLPQSSVEASVSSGSKLHDRHFTDAIVQLNPIECKVCLCHSSFITPTRQHKVVKHNEKESAEDTSNT